MGRNTANFQTQLNLTDSLTWSVEAHSLKVGIDVRSLRPQTKPAAYAQQSLFNDTAAALMNTATLSIVQASTPVHSSFLHISLFAQDTWQVKPRLTLNYGVRWAPILPQVDVKRPVPNVLNFDLDKFRQGIRSTVFVNAPPGVLFSGDPGFAQANNGANAAKPRANIWNPYWKDFAPRLSIAYNPAATSGFMGRLLGDRKTVIQTMINGAPSP